MAGYVISFVWGLVVLAAFIGWGGVAARLFVTDDAARPDWGLAAGWGMALVLAVGGVLALAGLARPWPLAALVAAGAALCGRHLKTAPRPGAGGRRHWWLLALVAVPLLTRYAGAVHFQTTSCGDDHIAYFAFVSRLLDTGTLLDPFSLRRLSAYGGQTFLQALVMAVGGADSGFLLDRGVAFVVAFGLVLGFFRDPGRSGEDGLRPAHYLVTLLLAVVLPLPLLNSSSHVTGLALGLTLFRTLERMAADGGAAAPRRLWLVGLVAAGAASLKATSLVMAATTVAAWWLIGVWRDRHADGGDGRRHGRAALHLAGATAAFLASWMALMWRSSGTPLFPLIAGNHRPEFAAIYSGALPAGDLLAWVGDFLIRPQIGLFLAPLLLYAFRRGSRAGLALYVGALITTVATVATLTYDKVDILHHYVAPFINAAFIATVIVVADDTLGAVPAGARRRRVGDAILWLLVVALLPVPIYRDLGRIAGAGGHTALPSAYRAAYARMQAAVPAGDKLLVLVSHPFALDYRRNVIVNVDVAGAVSPDPGMPFFRGPGALKDYLLARSIRYVAFRDFDVAGGCLYLRGFWRDYAAGDHPMWRAQARFYLDLMDNVDRLATAADTVYRGDGLTVIALR